MRPCHPQAQGLPAGAPTPCIKLPGEGPSHLETVFLFFLPGRLCFLLRFWGLLGKTYSAAFTIPWDEVSRLHATLDSLSGGHLLGRIPLDMALPGSAGSQ